MKRLRKGKILLTAVIAVVSVALVACDGAGGGGGTQIEISGLTLSEGTLSPSFDPTVTAYTATVANAISSISVTVTSDNPDLEVSIGGNVVLPGTGQTTLSLAVGANSIDVVVSDGVDSVTYTVVVTREGVPEIVVSGIDEFGFDTPGVNDIDYISGDTQIDYGFPTDVQGTTYDVTVTISNIGTGSLNLNDTTPIVISGPQAGDYSIPTQPASTVPPAGSVDFIIRFTSSYAVTPADRQAMVSIESNDADENPFTFALQANIGSVSSS